MCKQLYMVRFLSFCCYCIHFTVGLCIQGNLLLEYSSSTFLITGLKQKNPKI